MDPDPEKDKEPSDSSLDEYLQKEFGAKHLEKYFKELNQNAYQESDDPSYVDPAEIEEVENASKTLEELLDKHGPDHPAIEKAASEAEKIFLKYVDNDPTLLLPLANCQLALGKFEQSEENYKKHIDFEPEDIGALQGLGCAQLGLDKFIEAEETLRKYQEITNDPQTNYAIGYALLRQNKFKESIPVLEKYLEMNPKDYKGLFYLALAQLQEGYKEKAEKSLRKVLTIKPEYFGANFALGEALLQQKKYTQAEKAFEKMLKKDNEFLPARYKLAETQVFQGNFEKAEKNMQIYAKARPMDSESWYYLGISQFFQRKFDTAEDSFRKFTLLVEDYADAWFCLSLTQLMQKKYEQSGKNLKKYSLVTKIGNYLYLAANSFENGELERGIDYLEMHLLHNPDNLEGWIYSINLYDSIHLKNKANSLRKKMMKKFPESPFSFF